MGGATDWQDVLRSVFGSGLTTEWLLAYLETGVLTPRPQPHRSDEPAELARYRADATARENMFRSAKRLMTVRFDDYLSAIDQLPPTVLDLAADWHFGYPSARTWSPRCIWAVGQGSLLLRSDIAESRYRVPVATLVSELFETEHREDALHVVSGRRYRRRDLLGHHDAEQWLARNADLVRPFLDPDRPGAAEAWGVFCSTTREGLDPFLAELAVASTCRLGKLRAQVRPLARLAGFERLSPLLHNRLRASNANIRKESLVLLREIVPPEDLPELAHRAQYLLSEDRSAAVRRELDGLTSLRRVGDQTTNFAVDLQATIPLSIKAALEPRQVSRLEVAPGHGQVWPELLGVASTIGDDGLRGLSGTHLARLILGEEYLDEAHTASVVEILGSLPNLPSLGVIRWVELNGGYMRVRRPGHTLRALSKLSRSADFENLWGQGAVEQWILANLGEIADEVRSPAIHYRIVDLYPFLLQYEQRAPEWFKELLLDTALSGLKTLRLERRGAYGPAVATRVAESLGAGQAETRRLAAEWLKDLADPNSIPALQTALHSERSVATKTALLAALAAAGATTSFDFKQFEDEAKKGMSEVKAPKKLSWLDLESLPTALTTEQRSVDASAIGWLILSAVKTKRLEPSSEAIQFARGLDEASAARLGTELLRQWLNADQQILSEAEATEIAERRPVIICFGGPTIRDLHEVTTEVLSKPAGTTLGSKGVLAIVAALGSSDTADLVHEYVAFWGHAFRRHQCIALIDMLGWMDCPNAVRVVTRIAQGHQLSSIQQAGLASSKRIGERLGWSDAEVLDRIAARGFLADDGTMHLDGRSTSYLAHLSLDLRLVITDQRTGASIKQVPPGAGILHEDLERLRVTRRVIKKAVLAETERMDQSASDQRRYDPRHFCDVVLRHPVLYRLATQRRWLAESDGKRVTICVVPGGVTNLGGQAILLQPGSFIIQDCC